MNKKHHFVSCDNNQIMYQYKLYTLYTVQTLLSYNLYLIQDYPQRIRLLFYQKKMEKF